MEYFFWRFEKRIALSEKKPPLVEEKSESMKNITSPLIFIYFKLLNAISHKITLRAKSFFKKPKERRVNCAGGCGGKNVSIHARKALGTRYPMNAMLKVIYPKYYKNSNESCNFADLKQIWPSGQY